MSIASELTRIQNAKKAISNAIANKGVTVPATTKLDGMASLIGQIETGGSAQDTALLRVSSGTFTATVHCTDTNGYKKIQSGLGWGEVLSDSIALVEDIPYLYAGGAVFYGGEILGVYYYDDNEYAAILLHIPFGMCDLVF